MFPCLASQSAAIPIRQRFQHSTQYLGFHIGDLVISQRLNQRPVFSKLICDESRPRQGLEFADASLVNVLQLAGSQFSHRADAHLREGVYAQSGDIDQIGQQAAAIGDAVGQLMPGESGHHHAANLSTRQTTDLIGCQRSHLVCAQGSQSLCRQAAQHIGHQGADLCRAQALQEGLRGSGDGNHDFELGFAEP